MHLQYSNLYKLLNKKKICFFFIALALINKSFIAYYSTDLEADKSFYLLLADNIAHGKGLTIPFTFLDDPSLTHHIFRGEAQTPFYSILASFWLKLLPSNFFVVSWIMDTIGWFFLILVLYKLIYQCTENFFYTSAFILFFGFNIYAYELSSAPKDTWALALLFFSILLTIKAVKYHTSFPVLYAMVLGCVFFLPGFTKLTYAPITFVFPLVIFIYGIITKKRGVVLTATISIISCLFLTIAWHYVIGYLKNEYPDITYTSNNLLWTDLKENSQITFGYFPRNLLYMHPFMLDAIININLWGVQVEKFSGISYRSFSTILRGLNFFLIVLSIVWVIKKIRFLFTAPITEKKIFYFTSLVISLILLFLLSLFSLLFSPIIYKGSSHGWTYVVEHRSFLFIILCLQLSILFSVFVPPSRSVSTKAVKWFFLFFIFVSISHGLYFSIKKSLELFQEIDRGKGSAVKQITDYASLIKSQNPTCQVWLSTESSHLAWYNKLKGHTVLNRLEKLNSPEWKIPRETILLTIIQKEDTLRLKDYLLREKITPDSSIGSYIIYSSSSKQQLRQ